MLSRWYNRIMGIEGRAEKSPESLRKIYEPLLWQRAEEVSGLKTQLKERRDSVYREIDEMKSSSLNLHEREILDQKEAEYWRIGGKLEEIETLENQIEEQLQQLQAGTAAESTLQSLKPSTQKETEQLSKRKARILEEKQRLNMGQGEIAYDMYKEFGPQTTHLTTGRHQTHFKGNMGAADAESNFFYHSADTHGGKVDHGKKSNYFTNASGKRIRKR